MRVRATLLLIVMPVVLWGLYGLFAGPASSSLSSRFGPRILAGGDGKFADPQPFVKKRLEDTVVLATSVCLLILVYQALAAYATRRWPPPASWIAQGWCAFVCLNILAAIAAHTALFWCLLYTGKNHINNDTQWHIKQALMKENEAPSQAVLLGSSQTRAQIDTKTLNDRLGQNLWTTELHFPGSSIYDMGLCLERLPEHRIDYVITYLSEPCFYFNGRNDERLMYFFGFKDLASYWTLGPGRPSFDRYSLCGLLGDIFPLYQVWEPLADRIQTWKTENQNQAQYDASLDSNLVSRARGAVKFYSFGSECDFQKKAFTAFAKMCAARHCRLVVCCGQLNPILERALDPSLRPDMVAFLRGQAAKDANIVLLEESQMPRQLESDYEDLNHVNAATRQRFSQYIAEVLTKLASANSTPATKASRGRD
jgi:hypothetical protein